MLPTYMPGDLVLGKRNFKPRVGQVVLVRFHHLHIKRIRELLPNGVWIEGDNPDKSTDSRQIGAVGYDQIEAQVIAKLGF